MQDFQGIKVMPFASGQQRRFLWAKHPEIARRWADEEKKKKSFKKKRRKHVSNSAKT
jgi:hypothetical protein